MSTTEIRQKLLDYIRVADDRKVKAIYTILLNEIQEETEIWTDKFLQELNKRTSDLESRKVMGFTWKEVKSRRKRVCKNQAALMANHLPFSG